MEKEKSLTESKIEYVLNWAYDKAINGVPGLDSAEELAEDYLRGKGTLRDKANSLRKNQCKKCFTSGFVTGLGGLLVLPVSLPANITSVLFLQIRMIAAIAKMGGYDLKDDRVKTLVYQCLVANSCKEVIKNMGVRAGEKLALNFIKKIPAASLRQINKAVTIKLFTKFGEKGIINLGKTVPLLGGLISGCVDWYGAKKIGNVARDTFLPE